MAKVYPYLSVLNSTPGDCSKCMFMITIFLRHKRVIDLWRNSNNFRKHAADCENILYRIIPSQGK